VTDRDESGEPKAPVLAAGNGQGGFTNDRDADSQPRTPAKLEIPQAQGKAAMLKEAMTKKDFVLIADAIRGFVMPHDQRRRLAEHFASFLRGTNPNFLAGRFISYALGEGGPSGGSEFQGNPLESGEHLFDMGAPPPPPSPRKRHASSSVASKK
jgi:hypothetical protein